MKINYKLKDFKSIGDTDYEDWVEGDKVIFVEYVPLYGDERRIENGKIKKGVLYTIHQVVAHERCMEDSTIRPETLIWLINPSNERPLTEGFSANNQFRRITTSL